MPSPRRSSRPIARSSPWTVVTTPLMRAVFRLERIQSDGSGPSSSGSASLPQSSKAMQRRTVLLPVPFSPSRSVHLRIPPSSSSMPRSAAAMDRTSSILRRLRNTVRSASVSVREPDTGPHRRPRREVMKGRLRSTPLVPRTTVPFRALGHSSTPVTRRTRNAQCRVPRRPEAANAIIRACSSSLRRESFIPIPRNRSTGC